MSENNHSKSNIVSDVLDTEQAKNLTVPITKSVGTALGDICDLAFGYIHEKAEISRIKHRKNIEDFENKLNEDVKNIPKENLIYPKSSIVGPALEASKYYFDEDDIRNMFEKLIVNSMDNRMSNKVHPSFTEIIKQMSPLDAQNLQLFRNTDQLPLCEIQLVNPDLSYSTLATNVFMSNPSITDYDLQAVSIASLERVGLVFIPFDGYLSDDRFYDQFKSHPIFIGKNVNEEFEYEIEGNKKIKLHKGIVKLTPLGSDFIKICLNPLPSESNP